MRLTNINTLSALFDRLITERIKHFFFNKDHLYDKVKHQKKIIVAIKEEISELLYEVYNKESYNYLSEKRTFAEDSIIESLDELINADINIGESDRVRLNEVTSDEPSMQRVIINEKRLRKANETRARKKNDIDKELTNIVKGK